ncbi:hypothetical protein OXX69_002158 [Metschnikowia pulcherrima]
MSDYHNPLSVIIPHEFHSHLDFPTEVVAQRFQAYRDIVKDLISYLRQYASVQEEIVRQQVRLQQAVGAPSSSLSNVTSSGDKQHSGAHARQRDKHTIDDDELSAINQFFLPIGNGSIQDIPTILTKFHQQNIHTGTKTLKDITQVIIPKLEDLRKDLLVKVKEIKNLQNDFKNTLAREMLETRALIANFNQSIDVATHLETLGGAAASHESGGDLDTSKKDPYLVKIRLEKQLRRQLHEEAYLYEAYKNLQTSSEKLESIVVLEIQNHMGMFLNLVESEAASVPDFLVPNFTQGFLAKEPNLEWDAFVQRNLPRSSSISNALTSGMFIDLSFPSRKISDLAIPHYDSLINVPVKEGPLERRSKFLKSYSGGWYVLTCSFLHEFKTADRKKDQTPVMSLSLDHCSVSEHSKNDGKLSGAYKFVLYSKQQNGLIHRGHNWSFRCDTYQAMIEWYNDIKTLTSLPSPSARAKAMSKKLMANSAANEKLSRTASGVSAHSGMRSMRSTGSKLRTKLTREVTNSSVPSAVPSAAPSHRSVPNSGPPRRSISQTKHRSPKLSNLINSDGTAVASMEDHTKDTDSVDQNGNATVRTSLSVDRAENRASDSQAQKHPERIDLPVSTFQNVQNGDQVSSGGQASPQQTIPQNYQYYINQVNQRPQQFYDPVSQQFFMINAIPASQVAQADQVAQQNLAPIVIPQNVSTSQQNGQPMPQYFPSSPLPIPNQGPGSPNLLPQSNQQSPQIQQGQFMAVGESGKRLSQNIPHFPSHFSDGASRNAPYPVQFGENFDAGLHSPSSSTAPQLARKSSINERMSKATISDEQQ